jgi:hypothetical protein
MHVMPNLVWTEYKGLVVSDTGCGVRCVGNQKKILGCFERQDTCA